MSDIIDVIKFLSDKVSNWNNLKYEKIEKIYETVVEVSFKELEVIHHNYSIQLSTLREHLINRTTPPKELINWLRNTGLEYRDKRESLQTIEDELRRFNNQPIDPNKDKKSNFYWHFQKYVKSVLNYFQCTISHKNLSFYRDYEAQLNSLLKAVENDSQKHRIFIKSATDVFYGSDYVQDMNDELIRICDEILPRQWKEVNSQYRLVSASFQELNASR
ncbi:hypothetical protein FD724_38485 (plasmid) [Nostoc sp. C057]|jgi:hypothetical protein|uniref:hypothetical protein n=1 Tax=Nostoc sp. C057 TaxID=2576903 RepID=UPI0015C30C5F|nr:hypothetical protein [Nostoc sp. C057]QLE53742.1 hypothetical protein FD724_38485 [Nostoc sp. C057]